MQILVLSSSLDPNSRSRQLASLCKQVLEAQDVNTVFADLADLNVPNFDNNSIYGTQVYQHLHSVTDASQGIVLCSPVYNWGVSSELRKYIEYVGSTPPDGAFQGAF
ncbi:MAG: NAD(P)H-dependent oxidoreductase [Deinococcota bacterium]